MEQINKINILKSLKEKINDLNLQKIIIAKEKDYYDDKLDTLLKEMTVSKFTIQLILILNLLMITGSFYLIFLLPAAVICSVYLGVSIKYNKKLKEDYSNISKTIIDNQNDQSANLNLIESKLLTIAKDYNCIINEWKKDMSSEEQCIIEELLDYNLLHQQYDLKEKSHDEESSSKEFERIKIR